MQKKTKIFYILLLLFVLALTACGQEEAEPVYGYLPTYLNVSEQVFKGVRRFAVAEEGIYTASENGGAMKRYDFRAEQTDKLFSIPNEDFILGVSIGGNSSLDDSGRQIVMLEWGDYARCGSFYARSSK